MQHPMDTDTQHHHRPPVLFQSDDLDHDHDHDHDLDHGHDQEEEEDHGCLGQRHGGPFSSQSLNYDPTTASESMGHGYDDDPDLYGYPGAFEQTEPAVHVHSQACQDSCPVQDIYAEASFSRFSKGARTNLYGLVVIKELGDISPASPLPEQSQEAETILPSSTATAAISGSSIFTSDGGIAYSHLPGRYVLVAAGGTVKCFMNMQESYEFTIGPLTPVTGTTGTSTASSTATATASATAAATAAATGTGSAIPTAAPSLAVGNTAGSASTSGSAVTPGTTSTLGTTPTISSGPSANTTPATAAPAAATAPPAASNYEIVSMDAFERRDERGCQLVLVVSIAKGEDPAQFEVRFYGTNSFGTSIRDLLLRLPNTKDVQSIPLSWAPTKIIHAPLEDNPFEMAVLLAGSDSCVHLFLQNSSSSSSSSAASEAKTTQLFEERPIEAHYSVLASFPYCEYCVLSLVIKDYPNYRIVAAGTQNGTLTVGIIPRDPKTFKLDRANAKSHTIVLFAPITTLTVYTSRVQAVRQRQQQSKLKDGPEKSGVAAETVTESTLPTQEEQQDVGTKHLEHEAQDDSDAEEEEEVGYHLLVTCAIEQAWVYSDINKHGLSQRSDLAECSYHDSILAAHVMDADWDGRNEIMIGTYGRQLMVFKELAPGQEPYPDDTSAAASVIGLGDTTTTEGGYMYPQHPHQHPQQAFRPTQSLRHPNQHPHPTSSSTPVSVPILPPPQPPQWGMTWNRRFATPVYGISSADLNDDGLEELVITTLNGVSIFLPDPLTAKQRLSQAIDRMKEIEEMKVTLARLRKANDELWEEQRMKEEKEEIERLEQERKDRERLEEEQRLQKEQRLEKERLEEEELLEKERLEKEERLKSERSEEKELMEKDERLQKEPLEENEPLEKERKVDDQETSEIEVEAAAVEVGTQALATTEDETRIEKDSAVMEADKDHDAELDVEKKQDAGSSEHGNDKEEGKEGQELALDAAKDEEEGLGRQQLEDVEVMSSRKSLRSTRQPMLQQ